MTEVKTTGSDGLQFVEGLLRDIGAPHPAAQLKEQKSVSGVKRAAASTKGAARDCLAAEARQTFATPKFERTETRNTDSPSVQRGISLAGKDPDHSRFYGKGFELPPRESPGPIYQPKGPESGENQGRSFSRAPRMPDYTRHSVSNGPDTSLPGTVGKQVESTAKTAPSVSFTKSKRFNARRSEFISRAHDKNLTAVDTPAPTAYQPDVLHMTENITKGISFSGNRVPLQKQFISRGHVVDSIGADSPGPVYNPGERATSAFAILDSKHRGSPSFSFGRKSGPPAVTEEGKDERSQSANVFISREHSKATPSLDTPGPAAYDPKTTLTMRHTQTVSFPHDHGTKKRFLSKDLSTTRGVDSPGPLYNTDDAATRKNPSVASLGSNTGNNASVSDRFSNKMFIGKGMGEVKGNASPGPAYNPVIQDKAASFSISHKERHFPKKVFPGPSRVRFINKGLAKENMGAYSPGPKYDITTKEFGKNAPAVGFGVSDRYFDTEKFSPEHNAKFGTAEKPYTSPAEARYVSPEVNRLAMAGKCSSGPKYSPKYDITTSNKATPSITINAPKHEARKRPADVAAEGQPPVLTYAKDDITRAKARVHGFPKAERMPGSKQASGPAPTAYNPNHTLVERNYVKDVSIGALA